MTDKETLPLKAARKLNMLILHNEALAKDKSLQEKIIAWAEDMLEEARQEWDDMRNTILDAIITYDRKSEAIKRGQARDKKYAPFREYFKDLQQKRFVKYYEQEKIMSANSFVTWFLENTPKNIEIPYSKNNLKSKLIQLAQANNREFKKAFVSKS